MLMNVHMYQWNASAQFSRICKRVSRYNLMRVSRSCTTGWRGTTHSAYTTGHTSWEARVL